MKYVLNSILSAAFILSLLTSTSQLRAASLKTADDFLSEGATLFEEGCQGDPEYNREVCDKAITALEKATRLDPKLVEAYMTLANAYWNKSFFDSKSQIEKTSLQKKVIDLYRKVIEIDPKNSEAYYKLSLHSKNPKEEISLVRKTIQLDPKHPDAHGYLAKLLLSQGEVDDAFKEYMTHLDVSPYRGLQDAKNHVIFANMLAMAGKRKESVRVLDKLFNILSPEPKNEQCSIVEFIKLQPGLESQEISEKIEKSGCQCPGGK